MAVLVAASLVGIYFFYAEADKLTSLGKFGGVASISTTGIQCDDSSMPQAAQQVEQSANFTALSSGECYNYDGESTAGGGGSGASEYYYYFDYYNGTIAYPCGTAPQDLVASQIVAVLDSSSGRIVSLRMADQSGLNPYAPCASAPPLSIVSVADVESTIPAVPQLNLTLAVNAGEAPISSLAANVTLDGGVQTFRFGVTQSSRLSPGQSASSTEIVLGGVSFSADEVYPATVWGSFSTGQAFSFRAYVQVAGVP